MFYKVESYLSSSGEIIIPKPLFSQAGFINSTPVTLNAGLKKLRGFVKLSEGFSDDTLFISDDILKKLLLPKDISYQIIIDGTDIHLGPVIGLLFGKDEGLLTDWRLSKALEHISLYPQVKGLICLFTWDRIDFQNQSIEGYFYNPSISGKAGSWVKGSLPLPKVIFRRGQLGRTAERILKHATGNRVFNSYYFNKWAFWETASKVDIIKTHIPETRLLNSLEDLDYMLEKHQSVYLKKVHGNKASGLVRVTKGMNYSFRTNENPHPIEIDTGAGAENYLRRIKETTPYLVQQAVDSLKLDSRVVDFRAVLQKDESLSWKCTALMAKVGKIHGICSNFTESGYALTYEDALSATTDLGKDEILNKKLELVDICIKICLELDKTGENFGDLAIDVALDRDLNIWILEVNKEHDYNVILYIYNHEKYVEIKANPLRYAMRLSRFSCDMTREFTTP